MRATYCTCVPNTHLTTDIRANLFQIRAAAVQLAISYLPYFRFFDRIQTCSHPSTVMTDNSSPPGIPPPPRSLPPGPYGSLAWQRTSYLQFEKHGLQPRALQQKSFAVCL